MRPSPRSLILDLLATVRRGAVPVHALVSAGELFGIAGGSLRVALARLRADGRVERDERGRYRLADRAMSERVRSWRDAEARLRPWSGGWIGASTAGLPRARRGARRRGRALRLLGFRPLAPSLELRPDNLAGGVEAARRELRALGLETSAPVFSLADLDAGQERRARALWDAEAISAGYRATRERLEASAERLPRMAREAARVESFSLGGEAIRQIVLDPLLPEPVVDAAGRRALIAAMRRYDRLGRRVWSGWLSDETLESERCPAGVSGLDGGVALLRSAEGG